MTGLFGILFLAAWLAAGIAMAKVCATNGRDDEVPTPQIAVICGRCRTVLCVVDTREQAVLEDELHDLIVHREESWKS